MNISAWKIAINGFAVLAVAMGIGRFAFTPILPMMRDEGLISVSDGGLMASVHFAGYLMGALFAGQVRHWPSISLYGSLILISLATLVMGVTNSFVAWTVARWIAGFCSAIVLVTVSTHLIKRLAEIQRSELQGYVFAGVGGGILIAGFISLWFLKVSTPSTTGWMIFGITSLAAVAFIFAQIGTSVFKGTISDQAAPVASAPLEWRLIIPYGAMGAGYIIPATYLPIMASDEIASPILYGLGWPIFGLAAALSTLMAVRFQKRFLDRQIWIASQVAMASGLAIPALVPGIGAVIFGGVLVGGTFMVITMVGMKEAHRLAGTLNPQRLIAALTAAFAFGQMMGPAISGLAYGVSGNFSLPLLLGSALLIVSLIPILRFEAS